jgi:hypothetical protein
MNNEPVAWMGKDYDGLKTDLYFDVEKNKLPYRLYESAIPLYTHPAKTLTDFEIKGVMALNECWIGEDCSTPNMIAFARAILRKAQEK